MSAGRLLQMSGVVVDLLYRVDKVPEAGTETDVAEFSISAGGGFNAMIAAKRAGMSVFYGGALGTGLFSDLAEKALQAAGIVVLKPRSDKSDQGSCVVLIDAQGERTFISREGAEGLLDAGELSLIDTQEFDWVLLSGYALAHAGSRKALHQWLLSLPDSTKLVFDPSPVACRIPAPILHTALERATWVSANVREAQIITGNADPKQAARLLAQRSRAEGGALVRDGANGCYLAVTKATSGPRHIEGFMVDAVDTNGAGDTHLGVFIAALYGGEAPAEAAAIANAAAALSTTKEGPATAPEQSELSEFLARQQASDGREKQADH